MKVIIAGGRDYHLTTDDFLRLDDLHGQILITEEVSGKQRGADTGGEMWAKSREIPVMPFPADWGKYDQPGKKNPAGAIRNAAMAKYVGSEGAVVLFPGGPGTENMYQQALRYGLKIYDWRKPVDKV